MISVEKSTTTIKKDLEEIAKDKQSVLARRIVSVKDNVRGKTENTYIPIGGELPVDLPLQQDQNLIQNASDDTLYLIVRGNLSQRYLACSPIKVISLIIFPTMVVVLKKNANIKIKFTQKIHKYLNHS